MSGGKQTPRQKMIGMMYLVLTALLALNVSAEVLNAFIMIDKSIRKTTTNFVAKNDEVYTSFEKAMKENPNKVKEWKDKADKVKAETEKMVKTIQEYKELIITTADGKENAAKPENKGKAIEETIYRKDDNNIPGQIMILEGRGLELKKKIDDYRAYLLSLIKDTAKARGVITGINGSLNTKDVYNDKEKINVPWESANFQHLPLVGVTTLMSKMQGDMRNAEAEILGYLYGQIDQGSFKFNKIEAIVNSPSNYVLVGNKYEAQVFIAASDSTQDPTIEINGGGSLPVKQGKGIFTGNTSSPGIKTWGGVIKLKSPSTGEMLEFPFKSEYQVAVADISVSPTKMNVFYIGVPNPVDITASGVPSDKVRASITSGSITKQGTGWVVNVKQLGEANISVSAEVDGSTRNLGTRKFRVKRIPDPIGKVAGIAGGVIGKNELMAQSIVKAELENFDFDAKFVVTGFVVSATIKGFQEEARSTNASFTQAQKNLIRQVDVGKKVYIDEITAAGPDGSSRKLPSIGLKLK